MKILVRGANGDASSFLTVELEDQEKGLRSVLCEIRDFQICEEHGTAVNYAKFIAEAVREKFRREGIAVEGGK